MIPKDIHLKIRAVRRERELSQDFVASKLGIKQQELSKIEIGEELIDMNLLDRIAQAMNVTSEYIIKKEYVQQVQITNSNCSGNVGNNSITINNDLEIISEIKSIFEVMQAQSLKAFEEIITKIFQAKK